MLLFATDAIDVTLQSGRRVRLHRDRTMEQLDDLGDFTPREHMEAVFAYNTTFGIDGTRAAGHA